MRQGKLWMLALPLLVLAGCSASGPAFVKAEVPAGRAVIYFYRESKMAGAVVDYRLRDVTRLVQAGEVKVVTSDKDGVPVIVKDDMQTVYEKGKVLATLKNGTYVPVVTKPGERSFVVENANLDHGMWKTSSVGHTNHVLTVKVEAGGIYYVRTWIGGGARPHFDNQEAERGAQEIRGCVLAAEGDEE